jgi:hypothetical protein
MNELARCLTLAGALCAAASLAAQDLPAEPPVADPGIVVTGKSQPKSGNEAFDEVRKLSRVDKIHEEALARFEHPVCPSVVGLRADYAATMIDRIRDNAANQHVPLAKTRCTPNLIVAFVDDGQSVLSALQRDYPRLFGLLPAAERDELLTHETPVRVWSVVDTRLASGAPVPRWRGREQLPSVRGRSVTARFALPTRRDIEFAVVVFDREAAVGLTLTQLADYATMRGLTHTRPASGDEPIDTILSLFDADPAPPELTGFDQGYLHTTYYWSANYSAATKFVGIKGRAAKAARQEQRPTAK